MLVTIMAGTAAAGEVSSTFEGRIVSSLDTTGVAGFGAGRGVLDGLDVRIVVALDPSRAPPDGDPSPTVGRYATRVSSAAWLRIVSVEIGGRKLPAARMIGSITGHDADQQILVTALGDVRVFVDLDWEDAATGAFLDHALRIGLDGAARMDDMLVPLIGAQASVRGTGSFSVHRIAPGNGRGDYLGFDFRLTDATTDAAGAADAPVIP